MLSKYIFAFTALLAVGVNAQDTPDVPPCVLNCVMQAGSNIQGCAGALSLNSLQCFCTNTDFQTASQQCLMANCSAADQTAATQLQNSLCAASSPTSGGSGTGTGSGSPGSSSTASGSSSSGSSPSSTPGPGGSSGSSGSGTSTSAASGASPTAPNSSSTTPASTSGTNTGAAVSISLNAGHAVALLSVLGGVVTGFLL